MIGAYNNLVNGLYTRQVRMGMLPLNYNSIPGLISLMNFNNNSAIGESSVLAVDEKNQNNATVNAPTSTSGYSGGAIQFVAGDDNYVLLNNLISSSADFTFSIWFYIQSTFTDQTIVANSGSIDGYITIRSDTTIGINLGSPPGTEEVFTFVDPMILRTWNNLIITRTAGVVRAYLNNVESSTGGITNTGTFAFDLIGTSTAHDVPYNGKLDAFAFWDRAISQDSRTEIYERTRGVGDFELNIPALCKEAISIGLLNVAASSALVPGNSVFPFCRPANPFFGNVWNGDLMHLVLPCIWVPTIGSRLSWNSRAISSTQPPRIYFDTVWVFRVTPTSATNTASSLPQFWTKNYGTDPYGRYAPDSNNCNGGVFINVT